MNSTKLAQQRTQLANQRTFLAYMRTGFAIAGVAGKFGKWWIVTFGVVMIICSLLQYMLIKKEIESDSELKVMGVGVGDTLNWMPVFYVLMSIGALVLQYMKGAKAST